MPHAAALWAPRGPWEDESREAIFALTGCLHYTGLSALRTLALSGGGKLPIPMGDNVCGGTDRILPRSDLWD